MNFSDFKEGMLLLSLRNFNCIWRVVAVDRKKKEIAVQLQTTIFANTQPPIGHIKILDDFSYLIPYDSRIKYKKEHIMQMLASKLVTSPTLAEYSFYHDILSLVGGTFTEPE